MVLSSPLNQNVVGSNTNHTSLETAKTSVVIQRKEILLQVYNFKSSNESAQQKITLTRDRYNKTFPIVTDSAVGFGLSVKMLAPIYLKTKL